MGMFDWLFESATEKKEKIYLNAFDKTVKEIDLSIQAIKPSSQRIRGFFVNTDNILVKTEPKDLVPALNFMYEYINRHSIKINKTQQESIDLYVRKYLVKEVLEYNKKNPDQSLTFKDTKYQGMLETKPKSLLMNFFSSLLRKSHNYHEIQVTQLQESIFSYFKATIFGTKQAKDLLEHDVETGNPTKLSSAPVERISSQQADNLLLEQKIYGKDGIKIQYKGEVQSPNKSDNTPNSQNKERSNPVIEV